MRRAIWILWPSFLVGGVAEAVFFTLIDPGELHVLGNPVELSRTAVYTLGFFMFWLYAAASSALTCFLQRNADEINTLCPLQPTERPPGCPKACMVESPSPRPGNH
jgi:hypothetical protein